MKFHRKQAILAAAIALAVTWVADSEALDLVPDNWTAADTRRQLIYTVVAVADAGTTADIRNHDDISEVNPVARRVLGDNPGKGETAAYFAGAIVLNYAVSAALPPKYRKWWQRGTITLNTAVVASNVHLGLTWGF